MLNAKFLASICYSYHDVARYRRLLPISTLLLFITLCWGNSAWIMAKAMVAQYLIADAWQQTLKQSEPALPWSWADTWPVARLEFPTLGITQYVLSGSHGSSLAFGPGHMDGTALPHESGTMVINGHRDTHFSMLAALAIGDRLSLQGADGEWQQYIVSETHIVDTTTTQWLIHQENRELHLMTCYPFNSINPDPPLRYVIVALPTG